MYNVKKGLKNLYKHHQEQGVMTSGPADAVIMPYKGMMTAAN
jgi:hypothetical protein